MSEQLFANLGMYDGGQLTAANDALWRAVAERLVASGLCDIPERLERGVQLEELWSSGNLLFGQTCGFPFAARFRDRLRLLGTPIYSAPGCSGTMHRSFIVVSAGSRFHDLTQLAGARAVINGADSMTGRHLLGSAIAERGGTAPFFEGVQISGSHAESVTAIAAGSADVAAIDCVSYAHLLAAHPELVAETRIIHRTALTPNLPFVISVARGEATATVVARSLREALADPVTADARHALMLRGVEQLASDVYDRLLAIAADADRVFAPPRAQGGLPTAREKTQPYVR